MTAVTETGSERRAAIASWFREHGRQFPWRRCGASFWPTFLAEMLLRRTRAAQVAQALPSILERFPGPSAMAEATEDDVLDALAGLGLRWRAITLHEAAQHLCDIPGVPERQRLLELPGVGPYVADSVLAVVAGEDVVLTDTNSVRVATRVAGLDLEGDVRRRRDVQEAIYDLFGGPAPAEVWWAVIDLGATVCTPTVPRCERCPLQRRCATGRRRLQSAEA